MQDFDQRIAIVTGGGDGMGRELAVQLAAAGAHLAICDLDEDRMAETLRRCRDAAPASSTRTYLARRVDVTDEQALEAFRDAVVAATGVGHAHLLFNNAGIGGGGSFVAGSRTEWERTFDVCWRGVYLGCRVFLPLLVRAEAAHVVNTSSVNGFWASLGPRRAHTAYAAAKFAVKGFSEALVTDLRLQAPHVAVSVVMPGHIGTGIAVNSVAALGGTVDAGANERGAAFRNSAPTTAAEAATIILDGVRAGRWRILVGEDAAQLDELVRADPEGAYEPGFVTTMHDRGILRAIVAPG